MADVLGKGTARKYRGESVLEASGRGEWEMGVGERDEEVTRTGEKEQASGVREERGRPLCTVHV